MTTTQPFKRLCRRLNLGLVCCVFALGSIAASAQGRQTSNFIVQAQDLQAARNAVISVGGAIANDLMIIKAVNAVLTEAQQAALEKLPGVKVFTDRPATTSATGLPAPATTVGQGNRSSM